MVEIVGIHLGDLFPTVKASQGNLRLLQSQFGSELLVDRVHPEIRPTGVKYERVSRHPLPSKVLWIGGLSVKVKSCPFITNTDPNKSYVWNLSESTDEA